MRKDKIEIQEGHNNSSYFWIMPIKFNYNEDEENCELIERYKEKEISIEETDVEEYLDFFLNKYFDKSFIPNIKRDEIRNKCGEYIKGAPIFERNLEDNFYSFESIENMIKEIENIISLLEENKKDNKLLELNISIDVENEIIVEFYKKFIFYMRDMLEVSKKIGYELISVMGP